MTTTPDIEEDILQRIAALAPSIVDVAGADRNAWSGPVRPSEQSDIPQRAFFVQLTGAGSTELHSNGRLRRIECIVACRSAPQSYEQVRSDAYGIYDAVDLSGAFTGASGKAYYEMRAVGTSPTYEGTDGNAEFFAVVVEVMTDG